MILNDTVQNTKKKPFNLVSKQNFKAFQTLPLIKKQSNLNGKYLLNFVLLCTRTSHMANNRPQAPEARKHGNPIVNVVLPVIVWEQKSWALGGIEDLS